MLPFVAFEAQCKSQGGEDRYSARRIGDHITYAAVFDGHAGSAAAEWCARNMADLVTTELVRTSAVDALARAFVRGNQRLSSVSAGTTASVVLVIDNWYLVTANVGDSKVILCDGGRALELTAGHRTSLASEAERIKKHGGTIIGDRINGILAVTRSLGDTEFGDVVTAYPTVTDCLVGPSTEFAVIASDGLWDVCTPAQAVRLVRGSHVPGEMAELLVEYAARQYRKKGEKADDITVGVIQFKRPNIQEWSFESEMEREIGNKYLD